MTPNAASSLKISGTQHLLCSRVPYLSRGTHEARGIHLEPADPDLLQVEHQGIELANFPFTLAIDLESGGIDDQVSYWAMAR